MSEAYENADVIEDDEAFKIYINNLEHGVGIANSIDLIDKHEKRRDSNT